MITVDNAFEIICSTSKNFGSELIPLNIAIGRILDENIDADRDFPPFDRVTMDGIAISYQSYLDNQKVFQIEKVHGAGEENFALTDVTKCIEVMTGAILPNNTDTVIPYEHLDITNQSCFIKEAVKKGQNIHYQGIDSKKDVTILQKNTAINAAIIGVLATVGKSKVKVKALPKIAVISTGNELVTIEETPLPHQIRMSNGPSIISALRQNEIIADHFYVKDSKKIMLEFITKIKQEYDVLVITGGVSKGKFDYMPEVLAELEMIKHFHQVAQRPGKPFLFGEFFEGATVFAFPGNPVSCFMCTFRYLIPWLNYCLNHKPSMKQAILSEDIQFDKALTFFQIVNCQGNIATPIHWKGSGDLIALSKGNAFMELPRDKSTFRLGETYTIWPY